jgi:peptidase E
MAIKIFLHGGNSGKDTPKNNEFFRSVINSIKKKDINILCVYFARPRNRWEDSFMVDKEKFLSNSMDKNIELVMGNPEIFREQISNCDILYLSGGMRGCLKEVLEEIEDLESILKDKIVVGVSAGANILSGYYYSSVASEIREGIGLLPMKLFTHYDESKVEELNELREYGEELPVHTIGEEEFITL